MGKALFILGSTILASLGIAHGLLAVRDLSTPSSFTPTDSDVRRAMAEARLRLAPQTSVWLAWQGFNLSHSLGLVGLGSVGIALGIARASLGPWSAAINGFFVLVSAVYFLLAVRFWFRVPAISLGVAAACFLASSFFI